MPATRTQRQGRAARRTTRWARWAPRALAVAVALAWAGLLFALLPGTLSARAESGVPGYAFLANTPTATATPRAPTATATTAADTPTATPASTATTAPAPPTATATSSSTQSSGGGAQAPTPVTTRIDLSQPTLGTSGGGAASTFSPSDLTSNGLVIFTTLGCIVGLIGLLGVGITWITLVSDGWGPMLKAVLRGNRRGKLRFSRKGADGRGAARERTPVSAPRSRGGWR